MGRAKQPKFIRAPKTAQTKLRWRPHFVGEHAIETSHLDRCDRGSLDALLDRYWKNQGPLPDNDRFLSNVAKTSLGQWQGEFGSRWRRFLLWQKGCGGIGSWMRSWRALVRRRRPCRPVGARRRRSVGPT